ncbi:Holliday junction branch migration DNA helicase RuvB, partial [bacterium]|nr:Holliday junction branch migration DNA helicase RuvB [bacterium]
MSELTEIDRISEPHLHEEDLVFELTLRPSSLDEFIGQEKVKEQLCVFIDAAKQRKES